MHGSFTAPPPAITQGSFTAPVAAQGSFTAPVAAQGSFPAPVAAVAAPTSTPQASHPQTQQPMHLSAHSHMQPHSQQWQFSPPQQQHSQHPQSQQPQQPQQPQQSQQWQFSPQQA